MKIEILEESDKKLKFKMLHSRYTIPEMLKKQLLTHKEVIMASGMLKHPEDKDAEFVLVVKNAKPRSILEKSIDELLKELNSFKTEMLKAIPENLETKAKSKPKTETTKKNTSKKKINAKKTK